MPHNLKRYTGQGNLHFITFTCYQHRRFLQSVRSRNLTVEILGQVRDRYQFALIGYVFMPDHVHLLISEPRGWPALSCGFRGNCWFDFVDYQLV